MKILNTVAIVFLAVWFVGLKLFGHLGPSATFRLADGNIKAADLKRKELFRSQLTGVSLEEADFRGARLDLSEWKAVNASQSRFGAVRAHGWHAADSSFAGSDFRLSDLSGARFENCDLRGANFAGAFLLGATFFGSVADTRTVFPFPLEEAVNRGIKFQ